MAPASLPDNAVRFHSAVTGLTSAAVHGALLSIQTLGVHIVTLQDIRRLADPIVVLACEDGHRGGCQPKGSPGGHDVTGASTSVMTTDVYIPRRRLWW